MPKKKVKNKKPSAKWKFYKLSGDKIERKPYCPKCGPYVFLAQHKDRQTCGTCGYTRFGKPESS